MGDLILGKGFSPGEKKIFQDQLCWGQSWTQPSLLPLSLPCSALYHTAFLRPS